MPNTNATAAKVVAFLFDAGRLTNSLAPPIVCPGNQHATAILK
ncbi:MAG TPA: hypothetical protein VKE94_02000 [Gemmataceae bacterium]|nr:hypothetical protein [Gemmataceae bacterium]